MNKSFDMHLHGEQWLRWFQQSALSSALLLSWPAHSAPTPQLPASAASPAVQQAATRQEVQAATEALRTDPNMPQAKKEKQLRFKKSTDKKKSVKPESSSEIWQWIRTLVRTIIEGARFLVWTLGAFVLAWLVVRIRHWIKKRGLAGLPPHEILPSHVGTLDIRPQTLPDDVGQAAAAFWQSGQQRPALSLLYRGALSRLVHGYAVPIRSASTEGECVALSAAHLAPAGLDFFQRLVQTWQLAAYAERLPTSPIALGLCAEFEACLGSARMPVAASKAT